MNLWCEACSCLHHFTDSELERVIYTLQGDLLDTTLIARQKHNEQEVEAMDVELACLKDVLDLSHDIEGYAEHVHGSIDCRKRLGPLTGGVLRTHLVKGAGIR